MDEAVLNVPVFVTGERPLPEALTRAQDLSLVGWQVFIY
jgi:hypothetical protein